MESKNNITFQHTSHLKLKKECNMFLDLACNLLIKNISAIHTQLLQFHFHALSISH